MNLPAVDGDALAPGVAPTDLHLNLAPPGWLCPFCPLHCEPAGVTRASDQRLVLTDWPCSRAEAGLQLATHAADEAAADMITPLVDGQVVTLDQALEAAVSMLRPARAALFGGLATDVAGTRALYRLANQTGAVLDHAHGDGLMSAVRLLQDRGQFNTTLGEVHSRADLILCVATQPGEQFPAFWRRIGITQAPQSAPTRSAEAPAAADRRVVFLGTGVDPALAACLSGAGVADIAVDIAVEAQTLRDGHDLHDTLALLNAAALGRPVDLPAALAALLAQLQAARYTALIWEPARIKADGQDAGLIAEALLRLVRTLNKKTRIGIIALGGHDGVNTVNQTHTWLSGLPLRTRVPMLGAVGEAATLRHDPVLNAGQRLWQDGATDALLWVAATGAHLPAPLPAAGRRVPRVVLGHPDLAGHCAAPDTVFIPVAQTGLSAAGHGWRADGYVALPFNPLSTRTRDRGLPTVAEIAQALSCRLATGPTVSAFDLVVSELPVLDVGLPLDAAQTPGAAA